MAGGLPAKHAHIISQLTEEEKKYIYQNKKGKLVFTPMYKAYKDIFSGAIVEKTSISKDFAEFKDTAIYERYMLNAAQFSAAKSMSEAKLLQGAVFDENNQVKSYSRFSKDADDITNITNKVWLRTEYDTATMQAANAELFNQMRADSDLYPFWEYLQTSSAHPREDHLVFVGEVFRIGDPDGDACHPQNGWNCECGSRTLDGRELQERGLHVLTNAEARERLMRDVDPQFRFNAADRGILPKDGHSYFQVMPNANAGNANLFGLPTAAKMPDTLDAQLNDRIAEIRAGAEKIEVSAEREAIDQNESELNAIGSRLNDLHDLMLKYAFGDEKEKYNDLRQQFHEERLKYSALYNDVTVLKNKYSRRVANLLFNFNGTSADITTTRVANENLSEGKTIFKKIVGSGTALDGRKLNVEIEDDRAGFMIGKDTIKIRTQEKLMTICHEMAHWLEANDKRFYAEIQAFYEKRTAGYSVKYLRDMKPGMNYGDHEKALEDKFLDPYTGKLYLSRPIVGSKFDKSNQIATEITSMWFTEALTDLKRFMEKDPEHFEYIYKLFNKR